MEDSGNNKSLDISQILGGGKREVSPWLAVTFSLLVYPGSGQFMNRKVEKAALFGVFFTLFAGLFAYCFINGIFVYFDFIQETVKEVELPAWLNICGMGKKLSLSVYFGLLTLLIYIWAAVDSFIDAKKKVE
ncbi:hypothetical protein IJT10_03775 [bacterium]|nr:hypothetical protein [bacterium]